MGKKINWTNEASAWLKQIHDFISEDKPETAKRIIWEIYRKTEILSDFPEMGHRLPDYSHYHVRVLLYGHYRIVYRLKEDDQIDILGVFHGALDMDKYLQLDTKD